MTAPRTLVIGAGRMGRRHIAVAKSLGLEIVGVADVSPESLRVAQQEQDVPSSVCSTDAKALLDEASADVVIIATTAPSHAELTCLAAERGARYILCEKPMAISLAQCDEMIDVCARHGTRLAINHQMRYMEQYTAVKEIVDSEAFGGLASVTVVAGNFGLAMNGSHYFEMFRFVTGERPSEVTAWLADTAVPNPRGPQYEDRSGAVRLTTPRGRRFYMDIGDDQGHGMQVIYAGRNGQVYVDELTGAMRVAVRESQYRELPTTRYGMPATIETRQITPADAIAPTRAVLAALLDGSDDIPSGEDGRLAVECLVAAHVSSECAHAPVSLAQRTLPADRTFPWA